MPYYKILFNSAIKKAFIRTDKCPLNENGIVDVIETCSKCNMCLGINKRGRLVCQHNEKNIRISEIVCGVIKPDYKWIHEKVLKLRRMRRC